MLVRSLVLLALFIGACASRSASQSASNGNDGPRAGEPQAEEQSCWRDQDCVLVNDCCGCAHGGLQLSVRADKLEAVTERGTTSCEGRTCSDAPSQHRSCKATAARCVGGSCLPAL
jgi:hypothetical protein